MVKLNEQQQEIVIDLHIALAKTVIANYNGEISDEERITKMQEITDKICYVMEANNEAN